MSSKQCNMLSGTQRYIYRTRRESRAAARPKSDLGGRRMLHVSAIPSGNFRPL
jgi:hypothetical protein